MAKKAAAKPTMKTLDFRIRSAQRVSNNALGEAQQLRLQMSGEIVKLKRELAETQNQQRLMPQRNEVEALNQGFSRLGSRLEKHLATTPSTDRIEQADRTAVSAVEAVSTLNLKVEQQTTTLKRQLDALGSEIGGRATVTDLADVIKQVDAILNKVNPPPKPPKPRYRPRFWCWLRHQRRWRFSVMDKDTIAVFCGSCADHWQVVRQ